jgi:hypothetical protein
MNISLYDQTIYADSSKIKPQTQIFFDMAVLVDKILDTFDEKSGCDIVNEIFDKIEKIIEEHSYRLNNIANEINKIIEEYSRHLCIAVNMPNNFNDYREYESYRIKDAAIKPDEYGIYNWDDLKYIAVKEEDRRQVRNKEDKMTADMRQQLNAAIKAIPDDERIIYIQEVIDARIQEEARIAEMSQKRIAAIAARNS